LIEINKKRPELLQKGVILHTAKRTTQKTAELGFVTLEHPPYSPDIAPSDYHLFRSMQHFLAVKVFLSIEQVREAVESFFASKTQEFFQDGIFQLPMRWKEVIKSQGNYAT